MGGCVSRLCIKKTKQRFDSVKEIAAYEREKYLIKYKQTQINPIAKLLTR